MVREFTKISIIKNKKIKNRIPIMLIFTLPFQRKSLCDL